MAAAIGTGNEAKHRAEALMEAGVDVLVVDTAHGHSQRRARTGASASSKVSTSRRSWPAISPPRDAAKALIDAGVDAVKVGIGPGSICTTRIVAGVGVPQLTAIMDVAEACRKQNVPVIADGGIRYSGDIAKAIGAGADAVMLGSLFAGTDEAPGEVVLYQGRSYKNYRGMGSVGAMARRLRRPLFPEGNRAPFKLVPEGIEGRVPYKGPVGHYSPTGRRLARGDGLYRFRIDPRIAEKSRSSCASPAPA